MINSSANITLSNTSYDYSYPSLLRKILRDDAECAFTECINLTSFENPSVTFSVPSWSNYSVGFHTRSQDDVGMNTGWNVVALTLELNSTEDDRNITLSQGWNLIGYSSPNMTAHSTLQFSQSPPVNWSDAVANGSVQKYLAYYNSSEGAKKYQYAPFNDPNLTQGRGYWVYVNEPGGGNMTIKGAGGSHIGDTYRWKDLMFTNCTNTTGLRPGYMAERGCSLLNVTNAKNANWIGRPGDTYLIKYWDPTLNFGFGDFAYVDRLSDRPSGLINSWEGLSIWANNRNVTMIRMN